MLSRVTRYLALGNQALAAVISGRDVWGEELARMAGRGAAALVEQTGKVLQSTPVKVGGQFQNIMTQAENQNAMAMAQYPKFDAEGAPLVSVDRVVDPITGDVYTLPVYGVAPKRKR